MESIEVWQMAINIGFSAYLLLSFGVGCMLGHYMFYRVRG